MKYESKKDDLGLARSPSSRNTVTSDQQYDRLKDHSQGNNKEDLTLVPVYDACDILPEYRETSIGDLLAYHNLDLPHLQHKATDLLIGMCMDHRVHLRIPSNLAFVLRCAGANLSTLEFDVSFAIAIGGVRSICLIGHEGCRMIDVASRREAFVSGLIDNAGWDRLRAQEHFAEHASNYGIKDNVEFLWCQAKQLRETYPGITVAPLIYMLDDQSLRQITDSRQPIATVHRAVTVDPGEK